MSNARLAWIGKRIWETFEPKISEREAEEFLKQENIEQCFQDLLNGKETYKIFVHYQPRIPNVSVCDWNPKQTLSANIIQNREKNDEAEEAELFISNGDAEQLNSKCCYFLRTTAPGKAIDTKKVTKQITSNFLSHFLDVVK